MGQLVANAGRIGLFGASVRSSGLVDDDDPSTRIGEKHRYLCHGVRRVQRDHDEPGTQNREVANDEFDRIPEQQGHSIPRMQALLAQATSDTID